MISPASFNYYQECLAEAKEFENLALQAYTPRTLSDHLLVRAYHLVNEVPWGIVLGD